MSRHFDNGLNQRTTMSANPTPASNRPSSCDRRAIDRAAFKSGVRLRCVRAISKSCVA